MLINNINPDLIHLGPFIIRFYGIVYAFGFLLVSYLLSTEAKKKHIKNLDENIALDLMVYGMVAALIGARILHVISEFQLYKNNLLDIFAIWNGGLGFYGGLAGGTIFAFFYCKRHNISLAKVMDVIALPLPFIISLGRIANFMNSEHLGFPANLPWCVIFEKVDSVCRHPAQIYEALSMLILFLILLGLSRQKKFRHKEGNITFACMIGYGIARFMTEFFRINQSSIFGITVAQILSISLVLIGSYLYLHNKKVKHS